jgi:hypothetical protein
MLIEIPEKLNGASFYSQILPRVHEQLTKGNHSIDFDLANTEVANPEGFVNLFAVALMIKNKGNDSYIPKLYMPANERLINYMEKINFFTTANVPLCNVFDITYRPSYERKYIRSLCIHGIYAHSGINVHFDISKEIIQNIRKEIDDDNRNKDYFYQQLHKSLFELVDNTIKHNRNKEYGALGYYMAQKTQYGTLDFVISDAGIGYRNRIIEMIEEKEDENIHTYENIENEIRDDSFLYKDNGKNPNRLTIEAAVKYREGSMLPGLSQIKNFVLSQRDSVFITKNGNEIPLKPSLFIHSGNYSIKFEKDKVINKFYPNDFSGCHIKMEIPIP